MVEEDGTKLFNVLFYDGEREINIGLVGIYPSLDLKTFQSILSQKIGISPNQMSIYLVDRRNPKFSHESRPKVLISGRVSFARIAREKDCVILVVLKRSRRDRRRKSKQNTSECNDYLTGNYFSPEPGKLILLRRNQSELNNPQFPEFVSPNYGLIVPPEYEGFNDHLKGLQIQREDYLAMISNSNLYSFPKFEDPYSESPALSLCEECRNAKTQGKPVPFHCCVNDAVTIAFRSPAGPIGRPSYDSK